MATWILTIGNSDVQLQTEDNWKLLYENNKKQDEFKIPRDFNNLTKMKDEVTKRYIPPARVTGYLYGDSSEYYDDLVFPLLDVFKDYFCPEVGKVIALDHVYLLFSDQSNIFQKEDIKKHLCPFWMDTYTLEPLIQTYLINEFGLNNEQITSLILEPQKQAKDQFPKGIDHWNEMLGQVEKALLPKYFQDQEIYVSHQAGTPAISSAVQFASINYGGSKVNFLVSNQFYDSSNSKLPQYKAEVIPSSSYWKKIQIIKAKKLLIDGNPSAAKELLTGLVDKNILDDIEKQVKKFNLKPEDADQNNEFKPSEAAKRVRDALDLIEIFLRNENYLQAIALLAAAHETFLKAGIKEIIRVHIEDKADFQITDNWVFWDKKGLYLKTTNDKEIIQSLDSLLDIPYKTFQKYKIWDKDEFLIGNAYLYSWLQKLCKKYLGLDAKQWVWGNLQWSMKYIREYDYDLRNQLMHNLRGVEKSDLIDYLKGKDTRDRQDELEKPEDVFKSEIKVKFVSIMSKIFLTSDGTPLIKNKTKNAIEKQLKEICDDLDKSLSSENT